MQMLEKTLNDPFYHIENIMGTLHYSEWSEMDNNV